MAAEVPDWWRAGPRRVARTLRMGLDDRLEATLDTLPTTTVDVVVGERDPLSTRAWTASLVRGEGRHVVQPGQPHSGPHSDPAGFARVVAALDDDRATEASAATPG